MEEIRVRFAPSPTGYLHIGGARTALFNWLFAKSKGGKLILRIEDTDTERLKEDSVSQILSSLRWLGLDWDEGPDAGGVCGPYFQSERKELYRSEAERLLAEGKAYRCFCTPARLEEEREKQRQAKQPFRYAKTCRDLTPDEIEKRLAAGEKYSLRVKLPSFGEVVVHDLIHGDVSFDLTQLDDFVIMKSNGMPTYNFAVVVDDHHMKISHVLRAEEHLSNTPKQILLYEACGFPVPQFGQMPMILAPDRSKLSKRHGATSVEEFRDQGYLPTAIINYLTLLGWAPGNEQEIFTLQDTCSQFALEKMSRKAAVYDTKKLTWMNGQYLSMLPLAEIIPEVRDFFLRSGLVDEKWLAENNDYFEKMIDVVRVRVKTLQEVVEASSYFFREISEYDEKGIAKHFTPDAAELLSACLKSLNLLEDFTLPAMEKTYAEIAENKGIALGKLIHPTRLALTGRMVSPGLFDVMLLLGREKTIKRLQNAINYINSR